jgi:hypothetical protein
MMMLGEGGLIRSSIVLSYFVYAVIRTAAYVLTEGYGRHKLHTVFHGVLCAAR